MSNKLPVGDVMNEAVQFGLHRWATVLRYSWAPGLFSLLLFGLYFACLFAPSFYQSGQDVTSFEELQEGMRVSIPVAIAGAALIYLFVVLLFCGVAASLFRLVALGEERPGFIQLRMDGPALRVFFAYLIMMIITCAIWGAAFMGALSISGESFSSLKGSFQSLMELAQASEQDSASDLEAFSSMMGPMKIFGLTFLLAIVPLIYVTVKLAPFPPGSASENRLLLFGSFAMTFGHFWSILGVFILFILFMIVISIIYSLADSIFQMLAALLVAQGSVFALVGMLIYVIVMGAAIFVQLFSMAVQTAVPAIIYRRLKTGE